MAESTSKSIVLSDTEITGAFTFKGALNFDGKLLKGSLSGETLFIGPPANIAGNITADFVRVEGTVAGNITALLKCELGATAKVAGDVTSPRITLAEGATLLGQMQIGPGAERLIPKP